MQRYSEACEQNKDPILKVLIEVFQDCHHVLEIGSGTGQHAVYFAEHLPHLIWQPSDLHENLSGIQAWVNEARLLNVDPPIELDVCDHPWNIVKTDAIFTANTLHIMSWEMIEQFFLGIGNVLDEHGVLFIYGPFSYNGAHTSLSNARFDQYLKQRDPQSGVRDFVDVNHLAQQQGLELAQDYAMPINNRSLVWYKR